MRVLDSALKWQPIKRKTKPQPPPSPISVRCPSQIDLKKGSLRRDLFLAICNDTSLEGLRPALSLGRHLLTLTNMTIQSTFPAVDLFVMSQGTRGEFEWK